MFAPPISNFTDKGKRKSDTLYTTDRIARILRKLNIYIRF